MSKQTFKLGDKVWIHSLKKRGEVKKLLKDETYRIEYSIKNKGKYQLITEYFKQNELSIYKEKKYQPNEMYWMVNEFHKAFNHPVSDKPVPLSLDRGVNRSTWTGEEALVEFIHQSSDNEKEFLQAYDKLIEGLEKAKEKSLKLEYPKNDQEKIIGQSDALIDAMYFINGSFVEMGVQPFNLFKIVHRANMGKLHNGKPVYRKSDGKVEKPSNWERDFAPEGRLKREIERQSK